MKREFQIKTFRKLCAFLLLGLFCLLHSAGSILFARDEWFRRLDLERGLAEASLVLAARVGEITETKLIMGGKGEQFLKQFKFEPLKVLKGVFSREALLLTSNDLGGSQFSGAADQIEGGQVRLLILGRSHQGFAVQFQAPSQDQLVPPLQDVTDPLLETVKVLLLVNESHDRAKKVSLLLDGLGTTNGPGAISLLKSLERRALLVAQTPGVVPKLAWHLADVSPAVREAAAQMLQGLLAADYLDQADLRENAVIALAASRSRSDTDLAARVAILGALGAAGPAALSNPSVTPWLTLTQPVRTFGEQAAQLRAIGHLNMADQRNALLTLLDQLPLDAPQEIQQAAEWALAKLDAGEAVKQITRRIDRKFEAGLRVHTEINALGELPREMAVAPLLEVSRLSLDRTEHFHFAVACSKIADPRLVPPLAALLDPRQPEVRWNVVEALRKIDTREAAKALQPHLGEEAELLRKLEIAEFLGRHGIPDGYPYAIEHMAEAHLLEQAIKALAAIRDPKAATELRNIFNSSNNFAWRSASLRALGLLGEAEFVPQLLEIAQDLKNPLAPSALIALGDLKEAKALDKIREGLSSRNPGVVTAGARAAGQLLGRPGVKTDDIRDRLTSLLADADAAQEARAAALDSLLQLQDQRLDQALSKAVRDARLEDNPLLERIEKLLRDRRVRLTSL